MKARTIGARLAVSFAISFVLAGLLLLAVNYTLVERQLATNSRTDIPERMEDMGITFDQSLADRFPGTAELGTPPEFLEQPITDDGRTLVEVFEEVEASIRTDTLRALLIQGVLAIFVVGTIASLVGWRLSHRALQPVTEITDTARSLSESDLSARVSLQGPQDEVRQLADTFDDMLDRLERGYVHHRNFAAVASHELRTPLAVMRVEADNALDDAGVTDEHRQMAGRVLEAVVKSERMIEQLMALARSDAGLTHSSVVDLADIAGEVVGEYSRDATVRGVRLDLDLQDARVLGDPVLLSVLVSNLVDNAIVHNIENGWAKVSVDAEGSGARLTVANGGRRYTDVDTDRMIQPFERIADDRTRGSGLGLATAQSVVEAHGGTMHADPLGGGGLAITVQFLPHE